MSADAWREAAACRGHGDVMTVDDQHEWRGRSARTRAKIAAARAICNQCSVVAECRAWVMAEAQDPCPFSMVAAMTPIERNAQRRDAGVPVARGGANGRVARCGTESGANRHRRLGEPVCPACLAARSAAVVRRTAAAKERARLATAVAQ